VGDRHFSGGGGPTHMDQDSLIYDSSKVVTNRNTKRATTWMLASWRFKNHHNHTCAPQFSAEKTGFFSNFLLIRDVATTPPADLHLWQYAHV
jgi:hypothetical protein